MNAGPPAIDVAAWVGHYPFRHLPTCSEEDLRARMLRCNIAAAVVSDFRCLFEEDNLGAYLRSAGAPGPIRHWPVVNPVRPAQLQRLQRTLERMPAPGLRLLPNYHGYSLLDGAVTELMAFAQERGLIVQIFERIADERWHWMLRVPPVPGKDIAEFAARHPRARLLLCAVKQPQQLAQAMASNTGCCVDISQLRGPEFAVAKLLTQLPATQIVFGSLWPLQNIESTLWQVLLARIDNRTKSLVLAENAARLGCCQSPSPGATTPFAQP